MAAVRFVNNEADNLDMAVRTDGHMPDRYRCGRFFQRLSNLIGAWGWNADIIGGPESKIIDNRANRIRQYLLCGQGERAEWVLVNIKW